MIIPKGVNHQEFLKAARLKGIRLISRYPGVVFNLNGKAPSWMARYQGPKGFKFLGRFAFSEAGEMRAKQAYENYLSSIGEAYRYTDKRQYKKKHP